MLHKPHALQPLLQRIKLQRLGNALDGLVQQVCGLLVIARGDEQAHIVKAGIVVAGVGLQGFGQFLQRSLGVSRLQQLLGFIHLGFGGQFVGAGQVLVQELAHLAFGLRAHKAIHRLAIHHQHTGGYAANAKHACDLLVGIDIHLGQLEAASVFDLQLLQRGHQRLAGATPCGPEVHQHGHRHRSGNHLGFKIFNGDINHGSVPVQRARCAPRCRLRRSGVQRAFSSQLRTIPTHKPVARNFKPAPRATPPLSTHPLGDGLKIAGSTRPGGLP